MFRIFLLTAVAAVTMSLAMSSPIISATLCNTTYGCRVYNIQTISSVTGSRLDATYFRSQNVQDLQANDLGNDPAVINTSDGNRDSRINKETWLVFDSGATEWIETGSKSGYLANKQYDPCGRACMFWEISRCDGSTDYGLFEDGSTGLHDFQIMYEPGGNDWGVYVDPGTPTQYYRALTSFTSTGCNFNQANHVDMGIENSDDQNYFIDNTMADYLQSRSSTDTTSAWSGWTNPNATVSSNYANWTSTFFAIGANGGNAGAQIFFHNPSAIPSPCNVC